MEHREERRLVAPPQALNTSAPAAGTSPTASLSSIDRDAIAYRPGRNAIPDNHLWQRCGPPWCSRDWGRRVTDEQGYQAYNRPLHGPRPDVFACSAGPTGAGRDS